MDVTVASAGPELPATTQALARRMLSPLCGLDKRIGFVMRGRREPRFVVAGAELTGVHYLLGNEQAGSYHIGGTGITPHEALMRALGETVERYAQLVSVRGGTVDLQFASYDEMCRSGRRVVARTAFDLFAPAQHDAPGFRFDRFSSSAPLSWVAAKSLVSGTQTWVPAQFVFVGYSNRHEEGEPWLLPAVTTGTAAHTIPGRALLGAILELIQIDAAVGHWYSSAAAPEILLDRRTAAVERIVRRHFDERVTPPRFHWLPSGDLPGATVACVLSGGTRHAPATAIGLGIDLELQRAMYKALLEAAGTLQLAKVNLVNALVSGTFDGEIDPTAIFDLDLNVAYFSRRENRAAIDAKFTREDRIAASELPEDVVGATEFQIQLVVDAFRETGKELVHLDLTTPDARDLGFVVSRAWSPDTLSLPLPSAPPIDHPRFRAYGGVSNGEPHPYP